MFPQKDMPDLRIEPATSCTAVERGYDRPSQAGIYITMTLDRRTNGYDQDLCVLAKNSLIWIYTVFMHIHGHSRLSTMWYIIPHHKLVTGYYVFTLAVRVSVRLSVRSLFVRPSVRTSFPFDSLSIYKLISFKFCICICISNVSLGIVNGQISIIYHRVMAVVNVQKWFLASSSFTIWSITMKRHKNDRSNKSSILA